MSSATSKSSSPACPLWFGVFTVPSTETSVIEGTGWLIELKNELISEATHPPPSSTIASTPPPGMFVGQLYAAQSAGTFHGCAFDTAAGCTPCGRSLLLRSLK